MKWLWSVSLVVAGLGMVGTVSLGLPADASHPMRIVMEDGSPYYIPVSATVSSGSPIRWENPTPTHHTVTYNGCTEDQQHCLFDSGPVPPGGEFTIPGLPSGRYPYHCRIHPIMRGIVTVIDAQVEPSRL